MGARLDEAMAKYEEARGIKVKAYGQNHASVANMLYNMAALLETQGKLEDALTKFKEALRIDTEVYGQGHAKVVDAHTRVEAVLRAQGKPGELV